MDNALPNETRIVSLLEALLGRKVDVDVVDKGMSNDLTGVVGVYSAGDDIVALCICDVAIASHAGAALSMIPPNVAEECVKSGELDDNLLGNFSEILNIGSQWFEESSQSRVTLKSVETQADALCSAAVQIVENSSQRLDLEITISDYGTGRCILMR